MAFISKKPSAAPPEIIVEPPPPKPGDEPPPPPGDVTLLMSKDGGLNGQCWRAGQTVVLPASAADWYLAHGHATRVR